MPKGSLSPKTVMADLIRHDKSRPMDSEGKLCYHPFVPFFKTIKTLIKTIL